jgi:peptidoglycan/xylan/chitin deacetylase (PgdA/CDA1 family)
MSNRRQDFCVLMLYYLGYSSIRNLIFQLRKKPVARFLVFHDLMPENIKHFEAKLFLLKRITNIISFNDFMEGRLSTKKINTVITFDDGYKSWITHALPILKKLELPAIFFVSSGFVGLSKEDEATYIATKLFRKMPPRKISGGLKETDIKLLADNGFTIGGHTINHINLEVQRDIHQICYEIANDKCRLEEMAGRDIEYFAYPIGAYENLQIDLKDILHEVNYKAAVTIKGGFNNTHTNLFLLRRDIVDPGMPKAVFKARVYGNYDAVSYLKQRINAFNLLKN